MQGIALKDSIFSLGTLTIEVITEDEENHEGEEEEAGRRQEVLDIMMVVEVEELVFLKK